MFFMNGLASVINKNSTWLKAVARETPPMVHAYKTVASDPSQRGKVIYMLVVYQFEVNNWGTILRLREFEIDVSYNGNWIPFESR